MAPDDSTLTNLPLDLRECAQDTGKYRIVGRIGRGGMGVVYRAVDQDLQRTVALKFLPEVVPESSSAAQRFLREARAASALDHVNIGTIFGVEETPDHRRFIVMAYYEGRNLSDRLADKANLLSTGEAVSIAIQVARGLANAHAHGVIHRDIKPSNILLTVQGPVKIVDFGLARMSGAEQLTMTGVGMGTPAYMSPEQAIGESVDHRSDIWSLGVVLLEMLTRQRVFGASSIPALLYQVVHGEIPALDSISEPLHSVLARAIERDPAKRYQSADDFVAALEAMPPRTLDAGVVSQTATFGRAFPFRAARLRLGPIPASAISAIAIPASALLLVACMAGVFLYFWKGPNFWGGILPRAGATAPRSVADQYLQGGELMKRWDKEGNLDKAVKILAGATKSEPQFALGFARLAEAQRLRYALSRDKGFLDAAERSAAEALRLNPELAPVQVVWGRVQALRGNSSLAMAGFERAIKLDSNDADAHLAIARQYERLGRLTDAEAAYQKASSLDPDGIAPHDFYANFLFRLGRHADAIREWETVVRIAPDNATVLVNLGSSLNESGRIGEAISVLNRALQLKPTDMGYSNLGTAYFRAGRYPEAIAAYRSALDLTSNNYVVWGNLAGASFRMNGLDAQAKQSFARAIELAERSRKDNPRDALVHRGLAEYYAMTGNSPLARQRIETALALSPKAPEIQAGAAEVYELLGDRPRALAHLKQSLESGYPWLRLQTSPVLSKLVSVNPK